MQQITMKKNKKLILKKLWIQTLITMLVWLVGFISIWKANNERHIWLSQNFTSSSNHELNNENQNWLRYLNTYTWKSYCKSYFYINSRRNDDDENTVTTISSDIKNYSWDFIINTWDIYNYKHSNRIYFGEDGASLPYKLTTYDSTPLLNIWLYTDWKTPGIPTYFTNFRFSLTNKRLINQSTGDFYIKDSTDNWYNTNVSDWNITLSKHYEDNTASWSIRDAKIYFVPEPCVFDWPITTSDQEIQSHNENWSFGTSGTLRNVFSLESWHDQSNITNTHAWKPITVWTFNDLSNYTPGAIWTWRTIVSGLMVKIKEPVANNTDAFLQAYWFTEWYWPTGWTIPTISNLIAQYTGKSTSNQRWINPTTIKIYLSWIFVDSDNFSDDWTSCLLIFSWDDLTLTSLWAKSRNNNELWYTVSVSQNTINTQLSSRCWINTNQEYKRETISEIRRDAYDYNHSLKISHTDWAERTNPNQIYWTTTNCNSQTCYKWQYAIWSTWYKFNWITDDPELFMSIDWDTLVNSIYPEVWSYKYNVQINTDFLNFTWTDKRAGINSGTFYIQITGYSSTGKFSQTRWASNASNWMLAQISWTLIATWPSNWITLSAIANLAGWDRSDYTWTINNLINDLKLNTWKHYNVYISVEDFVWNFSEKNFSFRTPTRPNKPCGWEWTINQCITPMTKTEKSNNRISENSSAWNWTYLLMDSIKTWDISRATNYNYSTYYPDPKALITDFDYINWSNYINTNIDIVLTWWNWATTRSNWDMSKIITLTWLKYIEDWTWSYITWSLFLSENWGQAVSWYITTAFYFDILATNIYWVTGIVTYKILVAPSCTESAWCIERIYIYYWETLSDAKQQESDALANSTFDNFRYNHRFVQLINTTSWFYFSWLDAGPDYNSIELFCAWSWTELNIKQWTANWPTYDTPAPYPNTDWKNEWWSSLSSFYLYSWNWLTITWAEISQFGITGKLEVEYNLTMQPNWRELMNIDIIRPLTWKLEYSACEFTWNAGQASQTTWFFGCPIASWSHNRTWDVNRTRLKSWENFIITWRIEWWRFTWNRNWDLQNYWINQNRDTYRNTWNINIYYGWGKRTYLKTWINHLDVNTSWIVLHTILNTTGLTKEVKHEVYWIDNILPELQTWFDNLIINRQVDRTFTSPNTWQLSNSEVSNLIWDDEFIFFAFSWITDPIFFKSWSTSKEKLSTGDYINSWYYNNYKLVHRITFWWARTWYVWFRDRAWNSWRLYIDVNQIQKYKDFVIEVNSAFRGTGQYHITTGDFRLRELSWTNQRIYNYNSNIQSWEDPKIDINDQGTGLVQVMEPLSWKTYLAVYKWPGQLSIWYTWIYDGEITGFDFTDTTNPNLVLNKTNYKTLRYLDTVYKKPWDIADANSWQYDIINASDMWLINSNLTIGLSNIIDIYDFDLNATISAIEQAIIIQLYDEKWFIGWVDYQNYIQKSWFVQQYTGY